MNLKYIYSIDLPTADKAKTSLKLIFINVFTNKIICGIIIGE